MAQDLIRPRPDMVDGGLIIETCGTATVTAALWRLLDVTRQDPRPWIPITILPGEPGSGRTTIAQRFVTATQRNASCDLIQEQVPGPDPAQNKPDAEALTRRRGGPSA